MRMVRVTHTAVSSLELPVENYQTEVKSPTNFGRQMTDTEIRAFEERDGNKEELAEAIMESLEMGSSDNHTFTVTVEFFESPVDPSDA